MTVYFSEHAQQRAKERYGLDLSAADLWDILRGCIGGRAMRAASVGTGITYIARIRGKVVIPVIRLGDQPLIITFLPSDHFAAGNSLRRNCLGKTSGVGSNLKGKRPYKRQSQSSWEVE